MNGKIIEVFMEKIKNMRFVGVDEAYQKREHLRKCYNELDYNLKEMYKWYFFYELSVVKKVDFKDSLWSYINAEEEIEEHNRNVMLTYSEFCKSRNNILKRKE